MREAHVSQYDQPNARSRWPRKRIIWSCAAERGILLARYYLLETRWFAVYLHHLHTSDEDRALHDHPWHFTTFLLTSGYFEHTPAGEFWRPRFSILRRPATWQHRLSLVRPCWTLVLRSPYVREWGFITTVKGWMHWKEYGREFCD